MCLTSASRSCATLTPRYGPVCLTAAAPFMPEAYRLRPDVLDRRGAVHAGRRRVGYGPACLTAAALFVPEADRLRPDVCSIAAASFMASTGCTWNRSITC